ncbi:MAG: CRTAC1 family protein [Myxococcales bacterium]|nr:CRTAC1 family protein [Myxococcales bacterium]
MRAALPTSLLFAAGGCGGDDATIDDAAIVNAATGFVDVTAASGIDFRHVNGASGQMYFVETNGSGCGLFDYDRDGDLDLYVVQGGALPGYVAPDSVAGSGSDSKASPLTSRLYRNDGNLHFTDVTAAAGCGATVYGTGCLCGDYDGDGWRDLFVYGLGRNQLFRNRGDGTFEDVTAKAGVGDERYAGTALWADFDRDGDLDLYVGNYVKWSLALHRTCALPPAAQSYCHPDVFDPEPDLLYRNEGNGTFTDVTFRVGITRRDGKALGAVASDVDDDGDLDLFVANDSTPNFLYRNDGAPGELRFTDVSEASAVSYDRDGRTQGCMGCDFADIDGDLDQDLIVTNLAMESNAFYLNDGAGHFDDQAALRGISRSSRIDFGWGVRFFDFEDDGDADLLTVNGHLHAGVTLYDASQTWAQKAKLLVNDGKGRFTPCGPSAGPFLEQPVVGRGLALGDLDGDGDLDFVINCNSNSPVVVERKGATGGHWLRLALHGRGKNGDAIGARVEVVAGAATQRQELRGAASFASWQELTLHFGLGAALRAERITVRWPTGDHEEFGPLDCNDVHRLEQGSGRTAE